MKKKSVKYLALLIIFITVSLSLRPYKVNGEAKPITEANEKLQGISEQEQETLEKLFIITQEIEEMEREEARISKKTEEMEREIEKLDSSIKKEEENYDNYLSLLKQVLVSYQKGGPASYIDIILKAEDLTSFIKSLNLIRDISRNTGELLASIEESRQELEAKRQKLAESLDVLEEKKEELEAAIASRQELVKELEEFLDSLAEEREKYEEHLNNLKMMWENLKELFSKIVDEFARIIGEGHFTADDIDLKFNFFSLTGSLHEDTLNRIINENTNLSKMIFSFENDSVRIEIPDNSLVLEGKFVIRDKTAVEFVPESGTFYNMALEKESIDELFRNGPFVMDFKKVIGDAENVDFELKEVVIGDGYIEFTISTGFLFNIIQ